MARYVSVVYDPPAQGMPFIAVVFDERDMSKVLTAVPFPTIEAGEVFLQELAKGLVDLAERNA